MNLQDLNAVLEREPRLAYTGFVYRGNRQPGNDTPQALKEGRERLRLSNLGVLSKIEALFATVEETTGFYLSVRGDRVTRRPAPAYSYVLKHVAERLVGEYVSNGQLILVAIHLGFKYRVDGPNCTFNMSAKDIDALNRLASNTAVLVGQSKSEPLTQNL
jgi:hypothetical protein